MSTSSPIDLFLTEQCPCREETHAQQPTKEELEKEENVCVKADDNVAASPNNSLPAKVLEEENSSNDSDCCTDEETYSESEFDLGPDLVWRDDVERFEEKVVRAVEDRKLAACLIPQLYITLRKERSAAVGTWSLNSKQSAGGSRPPDPNNSPTQITSGEGSGSNNKKRQSRQDGKIIDRSFFIFRRICLRLHKRCFQSFNSRTILTRSYLTQTGQS